MPDPETKIFMQKLVYFGKFDPEQAIT